MRVAKSVLIACVVSLTALAAPSRAMGAGSMTIADPRCEYRNNPAGLGTVVPRLSWELKATDPAARGLSQKSYQILAASSLELLHEEKADLWNTGRVNSSATNQIEYHGKPLHSRSAVWWKVRVWDQAGIDCGWGAAAQFSIGLLEPQDWKAEWIGRDETAPPPLDAAIRQELRALPWIRTNTETTRHPQRAIFSKEFQLPAEDIAEAWIAGTVDQIGAVKVNGTKIGEIARWDMVATLDMRKALTPGLNRVEIDVV